MATCRAPAAAASLTQLADQTPGIEIGTLDVTSVASVDTCVGAVLARYGAVDLLVNNAGAGRRGTLEQLSDDEFVAALAVNFFGVARVTRAVLPAMRERRAGRIITVTSLNGIVGMPFSDAYNAAKFAVEGLMEGLAPVLQTFGIAVSVLEPGPVRTSFLHNAGGRTGGTSVDDPYSELLEHYIATMARLLGSGESAEDVGAVIAGIARDPEPHLRYQSSPEGTDLARRKIVDPTGDAVVAATSSFLLSGSA